MTDLTEKLSMVSTKPGVYLMKNQQGHVIYVGKAGNLKKRLSSYFNRPVHPDMKTGVLVKQIADFQTIITASETEALILESNLIKRHRPRYNVILKDDKRYPVLKLDIREPYPNLTIVRKIRNDGALYFGPYPSPGAVRQTLKFIQKTFKLRKCRSKNVTPRTRPCLHCQIEGCLAPCCMDVLETDYQKIVDEVVLFLRGRTPRLISRLKNRMLAAAENQDFETAAKIRDKIFALQKTLEKQISVTTDFVDRDVLGFAAADHIAFITQLIVRSGFLIGSRNFHFSETLETHPEILSAFIKQIYGQNQFIPREILIPMPLEDSEPMEQWLSTIKNQKVKIRLPQRGEKVRMVHMANQNAQQALGEKIASEKNNTDVLESLQKELKIDAPPLRVECFDNSNTSGSHPVSAMVVFENGKPKKSAYRTYKIKNVDKHNDYAYMEEVLKRRFARGNHSTPFPNLLMVDGGKGQLNIAVSVLKELEIHSQFLVVGIAKKDDHKGEIKDKIYVPGRANPLNISGPALLLLQQIRDEAHRFAVTFHRKTRKNASLHSILDEIPGIGPKRKRALLKHFGTLSNIRTASISQISALPQMNKSSATTLLEALARKAPPASENEHENHSKKKGNTP